MVQGRLWPEDIHPPQPPLPVGFSTLWLWLFCSFFFFPVLMIGSPLVRSQLVGTSFFLSTILSVPLMIRLWILCPPKIIVILGQRGLCHQNDPDEGASSFLWLLGGRKVINVDLRWVSHLYQVWGGILNTNGTPCGSESRKMEGVPSAPG